MPPRARSSDLLRRPRTYLALAAGAALAAGVSGGLATKRFTDALGARPNPAASHDEARERFARLLAAEAPGLNPRCHSQLLTHDRDAARVIVLFHGMSNCPCQFLRLGEMLHAQGHSVFIPLMPRHGLADPHTDALRYLRAEDLRDYADASVDLARGLGREIVVAGLSAGGTVAAWIAQHRPDVARAVLIAPSLGVGGRTRRVLSALAMTAFLRLPNFQTDRVVPFKDPPDHCYLGFSTRALGEVLRMAGAVARSAAVRKPAVQSVAITTNRNDAAVNDLLTWQLVNLWRTHGLERLEAYEFGKEIGVEHDLVDPDQPYQHVDVVYPILLDLIAR
jgi:pimeloyl-ACP methyl ester carboxylesterase